MAPICKCMVFAVLSSFWFAMASPVMGGESAPTKAELDAMADTTRVTLLEHDAELAAKLDHWPGYAVLSVATTKLPGVGGGLGYGVVVDNRDGQRTYLKVTQIEVGSGIGAQRYKALILFRDAELVRRMAEGGVHYEGAAELGAGSGATSAEINTATQGDRDYEVYKITETGALATLTVRALHGKAFTPE